MTTNTTQPAAAPAAPAAQLWQLPLASLYASPLNPRTHFNEEKLDELAQSIAAHGVIEPVLCRPGAEPDTFELIAGERRWRAAAVAGLETIPALIRPMDDGPVLEIMLAENEHRDDLNAAEQMRAYSRLLELEPGLSPATLAAKIHRSPSYVEQRLLLRRLLPVALEMIEDGRLSFSAALVMSRLPEAQQREAVEEEITELSAIRQNFGLQLLNAIFQPDDEKLHPEAGPCTRCPKQSSAQLSLVAGEVRKDWTCYDRQCWETKEQLALVQLCNPRKKDALVPLHSNAPQQGQKHPDVSVDGWEKLHERAAVNRWVDTKNLKAGALVYETLYGEGHAQEGEEIREGVEIDGYVRGTRRRVKLYKYTEETRRQDYGPQDDPSAGSDSSPRAKAAAPEPPEPELAVRALEPMLREMSDKDLLRRRVLLLAALTEPLYLLSDEIPIGAVEEWRIQDDTLILRALLEKFEPDVLPAEGEKPWSVAGAVDLLAISPRFEEIHAELALRVLLSTTPPRQPSSEAWQYLRTIAPAALAEIIPATKPAQLEDGEEPEETPQSAPPAEEAQTEAEPPAAPESAPEPQETPLEEVELGNGERGAAFCLELARLIESTPKNQAEFQRKAFQAARLLSRDYPAGYTPGEIAAKTGEGDGRVYVRVCDKMTTAELLRRVDEGRTKRFYLADDYRPER